MRAQPKPADLAKGKIERGVKGFLAQGQFPQGLTQEQLAAIQNQVIPVDPAKKLDIGKGWIERPTEAVLAKARADASRADAGKDFVNPKVLPGKVTWHKDLAAACTASAKSGKPVLLFHMMGKLDDQFC